MVAVLLARVGDVGAVVRFVGRWSPSGSVGVADTAATAAAASSRPPVTDRPFSAPTRCTLPRSAALSWAALADGLTCSISASVPATCSVAIEVPL